MKAEKIKVLNLQQLQTTLEKEYPAILSLHCEKHKITATLSDGRVTSIPTA
jgi:hypothetical protein